MAAGTILLGFGIAILAAGAFTAVVALLVGKPVILKTIGRIAERTFGFLADVWATLVAGLFLAGLGLVIWAGVAPWAGVLYFGLLAAGTVYQLYRGHKLKKG